MNFREGGGPEGVEPRGTVLVVDDEDGPRKALTTLFSGPYTVLEAADGPAALDILAHANVDVVVTDLFMPSMPGIDLVREAKRRFPNVEVIILTGFGELGTAMQAVELGAYAYLEKPFDNTAMLAHVSGAMAQRLRNEDKRKVEQLALEANRFETQVRVVSGMIHDLGSPLSVIGSHVELMQIDPELDIIQDRLETLDSQVRHCADIIRSTMNFLRQKGQQPVLINLNEVVGACLEVGAPILRRQCVEVDREMDEALPPIKGDFVLVRQSVLNLITNACQAMAQQEPPRRIRFATWEEGGRVCLSVTDTGPGIPEHERDHVFRAFYSTKEEGGTGLGLAVVKNVMEQHGGSVAFGNTEKGGARFVLAFPACEPDSRDA